MTTEVIDTPVHELLCRTLFQVANGDGDSPRELSRANKARQVILNRLVGKRRPGTHPAQRESVQVTFRDLTTHQLGGTDE